MANHEEIDRLKRRLQWEGGGPLMGSFQPGAGWAGHQSSHFGVLGAGDG